MSSHNFACVSFVAPKGWANLHTNSNTLAIKIWASFATVEAAHEWAKSMQAQDLLDASVYVVQMRRWAPLPPPNGVKAHTGDERVDAIINEARKKLTTEDDSLEARIVEGVSQAEKRLQALGQAEATEDGGAGAGAVAPSSEEIRTVSSSEACGAGAGAGAVTETSPEGDIEAPAPPPLEVSEAV